MQEHPTISYNIHKAAPNKDGLYPIKLWATFQVMNGGKKKWMQKPYSLNHYVSEDDWRIINSGKGRTAKHREIQNDLITVKAKVKNILDRHTIVGPELFKRLFTGRGNITTVGSVYNIIMDELKAEEQEGTFRNTRGSRNSIARFVDRKLVKMKTRKTKEDTIEINISFYEVTVDWIKRYAKWMKEQGDSATTTGMYLEVLRKVYKRAIRMKIINHDMYPFGDGGYTIKKPDASKTALSQTDKNRLLSLTDPELQFSIDFWAFSFFSYGLNMADIAALRFKDITNDVINVPRQKTANTSGARLVIPWRPEVNEIIQRRRNKSLNPDDYIFPILTSGLNASQRKNRTYAFLGKVNGGLRLAKDKLGFDFKFTFGTARHTFASIALENGASLEFIMIAMGHRDMATTVRYTNGLGIKTKKAIGMTVYG